MEKTRQVYPNQMPRVDHLLDSVAGARWLSKLDLKKGFYC